MDSNAVNAVTRMGIKQGQLLLEVGGGADTDPHLRQALAKTTGTELLDGKASEVVDAVIIWWREDDGDLVDELVDGLTYLTDDGAIWVLTPKAGRPGHVEPSDIQDAAPTAGLSQTSSFPCAADWTATKLVARKAIRK